jgi:hypothetical protein
MSKLKGDLVQGLMFMGVAIMVIVSFYFKKEENEKRSEKKTNKHRNINSPIRIDKKRDLRK